MRRTRLAALLLVVWTGRLPAQEQTIKTGVQRGEEQIEITYMTAPPVLRAGAFGHTTLRVKNIDGRRRTVVVGGVEGYNQQSGFSARRRLELEPGESAEVVVPIPSTNNNYRLLVEVDGSVHRDFNVLTTGGSHSSSSRGPSVLCVAESTAAAGELARALGSVAATPSASARGARRGAAVASITGDPRCIASITADLPTDWTLLSRNDVIVADAAARDLDAVQQAAIVDWTAAGGTLLILGGRKPGLPEGPLRTLVADDLEKTEIKSGFRRKAAGRWLVLPNPADAETMLRVRDLISADPELQATAMRIYAGLPVDGWYAPLELPGVGRVPVRLFLVLVVAYLAFVAIRARAILKSRRPERMLFFLPVAGCTAAFAVLAYGAVSEGLGVKGAVRSFTLLDQRDRTAVAFSQQTLFAAFEPSRVDFGGRTLLAAPGNSSFAGSIRQALSLDGGRSYDGSMLPARRPTTFAANTVADARERLRFRRRPDGGLDVLAEPGFLPVANAPLVVRDARGAYFSGPGQGPLAPVGAEAATKAMQDLVTRFGAVRAKQGFDFDPDEYASMSSPFALSPIVAPATPSAADRRPGGDEQQALLARSLFDAMRRTVEGGGWCGLIGERPAFIESLGLTVEWQASAHLAAGIMAEDDLGS